MDKLFLRLSTMYSKGKTTIIFKQTITIKISNKQTNKQVNFF